MMLIKLSKVLASVLKGMRMLAIKRNEGVSLHPYPLFVITEGDSAEKIEGRIKLLVKLYLSQRDIAVVAHINAILAYPKYITDVSKRCQLRRLAGHWRSLAWAG